jgi:ribonuclease G
MVRSISTISIDLLYQIRKELLRTKRKMITVVAHHLVVSRLLNEDRGVIVSLERRFKARITFKEDRDFHLEEYKIK